RASNALVDVADEGGWFFAPLFVEGGRGLGGDGLIEGLSFPFEFGNVVACTDEHVAELDELGFVAYRTVTGDDDGTVGDGGKILFGGGDHAVDIASTGIID